jgi:hypothetical protein
LDFCNYFGCRIEREDNRIDRVSLYNDVSSDYKIYMPEDVQWGHKFQLIEMQRMRFKSNIKLQVIANDGSKMI